MPLNFIIRILIAWLLNGCGSKVAAKFHKPIWIREMCIIFNRVRLWPSWKPVTIQAHCQQNNRSKKPKSRGKPFYRITLRFFGLCLFLLEKSVRCQNAA
jgi:hypothetical protein